MLQLKAQQRVTQLTKQCSSDEGIDSDDSQYGGWPAIVASDDSDSDDEEGPLETDIVEALRELCEAGSAHIAWPTRGRAGGDSIDRLAWLPRLSRGPTENC